MAEDTLQSDDLERFLPFRSTGRPSVTLPAMVPLQELPGSFAESLRFWPVEQASLMDPMQLITGESRLALQRLLDFHTGKARSRLCLLVLERGQTLPPDFDPGRLASGTMLESATALLVCPLGETWRSRFFLSGWLRESIPDQLHREMVRDCVNDAQTTPDAAAQLHRLTLRASTWLFRLEAVLPQPLEEPAKGGSISEISSMPAKSGRRTAAQFPFFRLLTALALLAGLAAWWKRRASAKLGRVWILDEHPAAPRLGGAFCGGCGATLDFGPDSPRRKA